MVMPVLVTDVPCVKVVTPVLPGRALMPEETAKPPPWPLVVPASPSSVREVSVALVGALKNVTEELSLGRVTTDSTNV